MRVLSGDITKLFLAPALFLIASSVKSGANSDVDNPPSQPVQNRQAFWFTSAHDSLCNDVMCIECDVDGATARYVLRCTGGHRLGWMSIGFGRNMGDSPMVVVWPSRGADGIYNTVTLSQRKAPYETMPTPDPDPPFAAQLDFTYTSITDDHIQIAFTRWAPPDGMQNIIWAYSRTPPRSAEADVDISIHHRIGRGILNLTRTEPPPVEPPPVPAPSKKKPGFHALPRPPVPPVNIPGQDATAAREEGEEDETLGKNGRRGGFASIMHGTLCITGFLLVLPSGVLVVQYAKLTGSPGAFRLHQLLQFGLAGGLIVGGTLTYRFMYSDGSDTALAHEAGSANLLLLYLVQCAFGSWVDQIPRRRRTRVQTVLLAGLGATIILLAFYQTWLGLAAAGHDTPVWLAFLTSLLSIYILGVVVVKRRFGSVEGGDMGEWAEWETSAAPNDEIADDDEKL